jgi:hypothetical protein
MLKKYGAGFLLLACTLAPAQSTAPADHWIAVHAGRLFDGTENLAANQVIPIKRDRMVKVGPAQRVQVPTDAEVVDLIHATVPGLTDAHTHVFGNGPDFDAQILRDFYQYPTLTALANAQEVPLPSALQVVDSPWAGRQAVRDQVAPDADLIKLYAAYDFYFTNDGKMVVTPTFTALRGGTEGTERNGKVR